MEPDTRVTVTDIDIPFVRLIFIFIKWGLAAIPATIIFSLIMMFFMSIMSGIFGGVGMMMGGIN